MVQTLDERDELKRLHEENKRLKLAYADWAMEHKIDPKVIEIADELYGTDLKKNTTRAIAALKGEVKVSKSCACLGVSCSGYYASFKQSERKQPEQTIAVELVQGKRRMMP